MNAQDEMLKVEQVLSDFVTAFVNAFGHGTWALILALVVALSVSALAYLLISGIWARSRKLPLDRKADESRRIVQIAPPQRGDIAPAMSRPSSEVESSEARELRILFEHAIDRQATEGRERSTRIFKSHDEIRAALSRIEASIEGLASSVQNDREREAAVDQRIASLGASVADLDDRVARGGEERPARPIINPPGAKMSAEIASIVRELQET